jgi:hypothetical protein
MVMYYSLWKCRCGAAAKPERARIRLECSVSA